MVKRHGVLLLTFGLCRRGCQSIYLKKKQGTQDAANRLPGRRPSELPSIQFIFCDNYKWDFMSKKEAYILDRNI